MLMRILTLFLIPTVLSAQPDSLPQRANAAYTASDWKTAAEAYATLAKRTPDQPMPHFRLGVSLLNLNRAAEAKPHIETAERLGTPVLQAAYRLAQAEAATGNRDAAFKQLERSTAAGATSWRRRQNGDGGQPRRRVLERGFLRPISVR